MPAPIFFNMVMVSIARIVGERVDVLPHLLPVRMHAYACTPRQAGWKGRRQGGRVIAHSCFSVFFRLHFSRAPARS